jgi:hypothetical protein
VIPTVTDSVNVGLCNIVEPPICLIHSDPERLAVAFIVLFGEPYNGNDSFVFSNYVK